jgi:hypothetical protein
MTHSINFVENAILSNMQENFSGRRCAAHKFLAVASQLLQAPPTSAAATLHAILQCFLSG